MEARRASWPARVVRARAREYLRALGRDESVSVLLTSDRGIRALKRRYFGKDEATDVLSFPAEEPGFLGDIAISVDTARRRAREDGRPLARELSRYVAHGLLHLCGYDHERSEAEARRMARAEARLLGVAGMLDDAMGVARQGSPVVSRRGRGAVQGAQVRRTRAE